jgi:hypothetical protein
MKSSHISKKMTGLRTRSRHLAHALVRDAELVYSVDAIESQLRELSKMPSRGRE